MITSGHFKHNNQNHWSSPSFSCTFHFVLFKFPILSCTHRTSSRFHCLLHQTFSCSLFCWWCLILSEWFVPTFRISQFSFWYWFLSRFLLWEVPWSLYFVQFPPILFGNQGALFPAQVSSFNLQAAYTFQATLFSGAQTYFSWGQTLLFNLNRFPNQQ